MTTHDPTNPINNRILKLCAQGYCSKEIADQIGTSRFSVNERLRDMRLYLNKKNTTELIAHCIINGIICLDTNNSLQF
jgi:DNA-binding CsgD family transcriptional regulator